MSFCFPELINYTQPVYVWRDDPNSRQNTIKEIIERATSKEDWPQVPLRKFLNPSSILTLILLGRCPSPQVKVKGYTYGQGEIVGARK